MFKIGGIIKIYNLSKNVLKLHNIDLNSVIINYVIRKFVKPKFVQFHGNMTKESAKPKLINADLDELKNPYGLEIVEKSNRQNSPENFPKKSPLTINIEDSSIIEENLETSNGSSKKRFSLKLKLNIDYDDKKFFNKSK